jgi:hypothetical protein
MHALRCLGLPTVFSSRGPEAACSRLLGDVVFLHTYLQSQDSRKLSCWMDTGGPRRGLAKQGKVVLRFFHVRVIFSLRPFLPFVLFQVSWPSAAVQRSKNMCLSVRGAGSPFLRPCWEFYFSVNGPNNGFGTQGCRSQVASYRSFACGSASSIFSFTKRYDSFSGEPFRRFRGFRCAVRSFICHFGGYSHAREGK